MKPESLTVEALTERANALTQLINDESDRLTRERPSDLAELVQRKQQIANDFNHAVRQLLVDKEAIRAASRELRETLLSALEHFDQSLLRNGTLLLKLQRHKQDMLSTIAEELHPGSRTPTSYAPGKPMKYGSQRAPLAINAVI
jgi:flagellar biosynthesis/type III secretory pathway chaperone